MAAIVATSSDKNEFRSSHRRRLVLILGCCLLASLIVRRGWIVRDVPFGLLTIRSTFHRVRLLQRRRGTQWHGLDPCVGEVFRERHVQRLRMRYRHRRA